MCVCGGWGQGVCWENQGEKRFYGVNFEFLVFQSKIFKKNIMLTLFLIYGENAILEEEYYINYVKGRRQQISPEFGHQEILKFLVASALLCIVPNWSCLVIPSFSLFL